MSDVVVPDYYERIRQGAIINNPCAMTVDLFEVVGSGIYAGRRLSDNALYEVKGDGSLTAWLYAWNTQKPNFGSAVPTLDKSAIQHRAELKALTHVDSSPYEFLEDVGELRETYSFLTGKFSSVRRLAKTFNKATRSAMRNKGRIARNYATASADVWLEYRFAVMPLVRSALSLTEAIGQNVIVPKRRSAHGKENGISALGTKSATTFWNPHTVHWTQTRYKKVEYHAAILYEVTNPAKDWQIKYGLRTKDIPETAWNLLPLSFMADRIVSISSSIRAITNLLDPSLRTLAASIRVKETEVIETTAHSITPGAGWSVSISPDTTHDESFSYVRTIWLPDILSAVPVLNIERLYNSGSKILDLASLSWKLFLNKR